MAKASTKATVKVESKPASKAAVKKATAKAVSKSAPDIETISKTVLEKLIALKLDAQLQADLEWCLGSYSHDKNPVGLLEALHRAASLLKAELSKKTKGVTAKLIKEIEDTAKA